MSTAPCVGERLFERYDVLEILVDSDVEYVCRCRDVMLHREVMLESTGDALAAIPATEGMNRALREARTLAGLKGPGIPKILDVLTGRTWPILVLDSYAGETLASRLAREGPLPPEEVRSLLVDLTAALATVHGQGAIHRDISSEHVILHPDGRTTLRGFRFSKVAQVCGGQSSLTRERALRPKEGERGPLPMHLAPEQGSCAPSSSKSDLFALGCVAYEAATGEAIALASDRGIWRPPAPLKRVAPALESSVANLIEQCLQRAPHKRPESAQAILDQLCPASGGIRHRGWLVATVAAGAASLTIWLVGFHGDTHLTGGDGRDRGFERPEIFTASPQHQEGFGSSRALVIGISSYEHLSDLKTASGDAVAIAERLKSLTAKPWKVKLFADEGTTRTELSEQVQRFKESLGPEDRALFYFAGHGAQDEMVDYRGYLLPSDATPDDPSTWIPFGELEGLRSSRGPKHSLVMLDCCFGGAANSRGYGGAPRTSGSVNHLQALRWTKEPAWALITSGLPNELVHDQWFGGGLDGDHSPFANAVLSAFDAERSTLTARELAAHVSNTYLARRVEGQSASFTQMPMASGGQFVFFLGDE